MSGRPQRGRGRGGGRGGGDRGGSSNRGRGRGRGAPADIQVGLHAGNTQVTTVGVKRPGYGAAGTPRRIQANTFPVELPTGWVYHYDVAVNADEKKLPVRFNRQLIERLQDDNPQTFSNRGVYDGRKNLFTSQELIDNGSPLMTRTFHVAAAPARPSTAEAARPPKLFSVTLKRVSQVNLEILHRFVQGMQSYEESVSTALQALNVVIRMQPSLTLPSNSSSFFTDRETRDIGGGIVLWRGFFTSLRPGMGRAFVNVDISTGAMYKPGPLIRLCMEHLGPSFADPRKLENLSDRVRIGLQQWIANVRFKVMLPGKPEKVAKQKKGSTVAQQGGPSPRERIYSIQQISAESAMTSTFTYENQPMTVAQYYQMVYGVRLQYPRLPCVKVGSDALFPLEFCEVLPGQLMRKRVPPECTNDVLVFSTKKPDERFQSIVTGLQTVLMFGQSSYVNQFGLKVDTAQGPMTVDSRILQPPTLLYNPKSKQQKMVPRDGAWNMVDKKLFAPCQIREWVVAIYDSRFREQSFQNVVQGFIQACRTTGIGVMNEQPGAFQRFDGQGDISSDLQALGAACFKNRREGPSLFLVVLPENGNQLWSAVKHWGDVEKGIPTQCVKAQKCAYAKIQYWANIVLKVNVKMGGINVVPDSVSVPSLTDPHSPTLVLGADVTHPAPGSDGKPSFAAVVGNVDSQVSKYIARMRVQQSRQEMITDLQAMAKDIISQFVSYHQSKKMSVQHPKKILYFRDGVSEGEFPKVLERELAAIKGACAELKVNATITVVIVGKRHHIRFKPNTPADGDKSGNVKAGTVVDRDITHPTEFDFYLQSHGGLLGTSRSAHYSILYDENKFSADALQSLCYALCHVYARSTRSVSIPAPVYYAHIVCARAKNHFSSNLRSNIEDVSVSMQSTQAQDAETRLMNDFKPAHPNISKLMYFM